MKNSTIRSMKNRLLIPFAAILLIQTVLLSVFFLFGGFSGSLRSNSIEIFRESTQNSELNMEREMVQHWMGDIRSAEAVRSAIEQVLREERKTAEQIQTDSALNRTIVYGCMDQLIDLLHRSYGNGIYLILDGPAANSGDPKTRAGVYIRDMDSSSYALDNSDLLLMRGLPSISRSYKIPLDSYWELGFSLEEENPISDFFYKPYHNTADIRISPREANNYAYLGVRGADRENRMDGIMYSIPLTLSDGTTIGVLGGDMQASLVRDIMNIDEIVNDVDTVQILARRQRGSDSLFPVVTSGAVYDQYFGRGRELVYEPTGERSIGRVSDRNGESWLAAMVPVEVYNTNTPFYDEEWVVVRLQRESILLDFYNQTRRILLLTVVVSLLLSILATMLVGDLSTRPLQTLVEELRSAEIGKRIHLRKTRINEVDELIEAIEALSSDVAESASRISRILEVSGVAIGVFEILKDNGKVFCSRSLFRILNLSEIEEDYLYLTREEFEQMMRILQNPDGDKDNSTYRLMRDGGYFYVRLQLVTMLNGNVTGVLSDVTTEVEERRKLERERNYDLLTDIYNRRAFKELVTDVLNHQTVGTAAMVMWDLDNLKYINDTYGHETGDRYICLFAEHLRSLEEEGAMVERHSGDEFMAFLYGGNEAGLWERISRFMVQLKDVTLEVQGGYQIPLRASAGVAWYPRQARDFDTMTRYADFAMYMAKHSVKGIVQEFDITSYLENSYMISGKEELNRLLETRNVRFAMQPIVARDGSIYGYEALMRPQLEHLKNIQEVLNLAKSQAKLQQFEELTWFGALEWISARLEQFEASTRFFINSVASTALSVSQVEQLSLCYGGLMKRVVLEMTETEQLDERGLNIKITAIRKWGGMIALDDYGTGYNNDGILLRMNPDLVKLDMELVRNIHRDENRREIAANLIQYCHERNIRVVAEGVESIEELETLMRLQVDFFQGYYLARPELEVRPINPYVVEKMRELSQK